MQIAKEEINAKDKYKAEYQTLKLQHDILQDSFEALNLKYEE